MRLWASRVLAALLLLPALPPAAAGADTPESAPPRRRPTIGVALEGGGAFGLAHIGVLEWFEAHHIPVDYVAGTSMGALIGGLYAVGKSPAELRTLTQELDWDLVLGGTTPFRNLTFRRREDLRAYPNSFLLGLRHGVRLPPGLNAGQQITLLMNRETMAYSEIQTFDDLPIPFRCVATELVTGQAHVFSDGPLSEALRATMSIPGFFTPIRVGEHVYADGGIVNNLPTDVVRQMGADIVVAVHLDERKVGAADIQSMFQIVGRTIDLGIIANEARGLAAADIAVSVDVSKLSARDYASADTFIAKGREAAEAVESVFQPYALADGAWAEYLEARQGRRRHITPLPQFVRVEGTDARAQRHLEDFLAPFVGKPIDGPRLDRDLTRLTGIGKFSRVGYRIVREAGREGLLVTVEENDYAPPMLQPGFELDGSDVGSVGFTLGARLTVMDVGGYRSEWRTDLSLGSMYGLRSEYYRPLTASSKWFVAPEAGATSTTLRVEGKSDPVAEYRVRYAGTGVDLGYGFSRFLQARLGYEIGYRDVDLRLGENREHVGRLLPRHADAGGVRLSAGDVDRARGPDDAVGLGIGGVLGEHDHAVGPLQLHGAVEQHGRGALAEPSFFAGDRKGAAAAVAFVEDDGGVFELAGAVFVGELFLERDVDVFAPAVDVRRAAGGDLHQRLRVGAQGRLRRRRRIAALPFARDEKRERHAEHGDHQSGVTLPASHAASGPPGSTRRTYSHCTGSVRGRTRRRARPCAR